MSNITDRRTEEKLKNKTAPNQLPVQAGDLPVPSPTAQLAADLAAIEREGSSSINPRDLWYGTADVRDIGLALAGHPQLEALRRRFDAVDRPATAVEIGEAVLNRYVNRLNLQDHLDKGAVTAAYCNMFAELKVTFFALERAADELFRKGVWLPSPNVEKAIQQWEGKAGHYRTMLAVAGKGPQPPQIAEAGGWVRSERPPQRPQRPAEELAAEWSRKYGAVDGGRAR